LASLWGSPAFAQEAAAEASGPTALEDTGVADEITVTARKRSERSTDVPVQIAVFTSEDIAEAGIRDVPGVTASIANFSYVKTQNPGTIFLNLRGIGQYRNSEPPVAIVLDGVQMVSTDAITQELFDVQQIEVLKGPQGALFGRNALAGAINITTKKPDNNFEGAVEATYGNGDDLRARAFLSGPIVEDRIFLRVSGSARKFDGVIPNVTLGRPADFYDDTNLRGRLIVKPSDQITLDFRASYSKLTAGTSYWASIVDSNGFSLNGVANTFAFPVTSDTEGKDQRRLEEYALKFDYDFGSVVLTSVTARSVTNEGWIQDLDFTRAPALTFAQDRSVKSWSQEVRLSSTGNSAFSWVLGGDYLTAQRNLGTDVRGASANVGTYFGPGFNNGQVSVNAFVPNAPFDLTIANFVTTERNKAWALFGNAEYKVGDHWKITAGLRYDVDDRDFVDTNNGITRQKRFSSLQPKIDVAYMPIRDLNIYGSWGKGFRSGGFNQTATVRPLYDAEEVSTFEAGFKSEWLVNRLSVNGAVFHTDITNRQDFFFIAGVQTVVTVPKASVTGQELDISFRPTRGLQLYLNGGLLQTKIKGNVVGLDPTITGLPANFSFIGNKIPLAYGWSVTAGAQYEHEFDGEMALIARADYSARGDMAWELHNLDRQNTVHLVNTRLTLRHGDIEFTGWIENLLNTKYYQEFVSRESSALTVDLGFPASPRRYGATLSVKF
jgi:iron complex outermembrane receptor protein